MKRRSFFSTAAAIGAGAAITRHSNSALAAQKVPEKRLQVYKCTRCNTIVEVVEPGMPSLVHCGKPMELLEEQVADPAENKHVPIIEAVDGGFRVTVGSTAHPMTDDHFIAWIELIADGKIYRQFLKVGDAPEAVFQVKADKVTAREYCNLHGLWKNQ